ncbi:RTA1-domain-containing protein [Amniculicola lignicola CBS 123094]|uniref:RTA1-domain-containing protein n=1 Tax=Amniculicola lignicola CBS 123094 TaxID=1392246 RepID=A0A6A5X060_9PLEO|nr:RTA1-domain-containing protein [Amniculicola lignicola CBS 123094]
MPEKVRDFYKYEPNIPAAVIFAVCFAVASGYHIWLMAKKRAWFLIPFIIGGIFEAIGYLGRVVSAKNQQSLGPYIIQTLFLLIAPALFAASIYMILGRIILLTDGERYAILRRTWLTKIFVFGDIACFLIQSLGGSIMASNTNDIKKTKRGQDIILVGLWVQIAIFGFFILVAALFQFRARTHFKTLDPAITWKKHLVVLYATSFLILIRSLFRVIEYIQGHNGYLLRHEVFLFLFDACLMLATMVCMAVVHPGDIAPMLKAKGNTGGGQFVEMHNGDESHGNAHAPRAYV